VTSAGSFAQETPGAQSGSVRLSRFGDLLREDHIELTEPSLIRALKNPNPEVRFLASMKLAEDKAIDAIPEVKEALAAEKVPRTRVNLAVGLGLLGDPGGRDELEGLCADQNFLRSSFFMPFDTYSIFTSKRTRDASTLQRR
jgi:HEAT repeat protein